MNAPNTSAARRSRRTGLPPAALAALLLCLTLPPSRAQAPAQDTSPAALRQQAVLLLTHAQPGAALLLLEEAYRQDRLAEDGDAEAKDLLGQAAAYTILRQPASALELYTQRSCIWPVTSRCTARRTRRTCCWATGATSAWPIWPKTRTGSGAWSC